jgi:hypothetical protein
MKANRYAMILTLSAAYFANSSAITASAQVPTLADCTQACESTHERVSDFRVEGRNAHCVCECKPGWARKTPEAACALSPEPKKKQQLKVANVSFVHPKKVSGEFVCPADHPQYHFAPLRNGHPDENTCWPADVVPCQSINRVWSCPAGKACGDPEAGPNGQTADSSRECR